MAVVSLLRSDGRRSGGARTRAGDGRDGRLREKNRSLQPDLVGVTGLSLPSLTLLGLLPVRFPGAPRVLAAALVETAG